MTQFSSLGRALFLGLCIGGYTSNILADIDGESKFSDPARLYESFLSDEDERLAEKLAELDPSFTPGNIDSILESLAEQRDTTQTDLGGVNTARETLDSILVNIPNEISAESGADVLSSAGQLRSDIQSLLSLDDTELEIALNDLGLDPTAVTRTTMEEWDSSLESQMQNLVSAQEAAAEAQETLETISSTIAAIEAITEQYDVKKGEITAAIEGLTPEQIFALNRSLNNATNNGLLELMQEHDLEILLAVLDGNYNKQQINALTKAYEEEAKFLEKGMEDKAEMQKAKFLAKVDAKAALSDDLSATTGGAAKIAAKSAAKDAAKQAARGAAKSAAKKASKSAAKDAAKNAAKQAAKNAAKDAAKDVAKNAAKQAAKQAARSAAKQAGRGRS